MSRFRPNAYTRPCEPLALLAAAAAFLAACGSPGGSPAGGGPGSHGSAGSSPAAHAPAAGGPVLELRRTSLGLILTDGQGFTLYAFGADRDTTSRCTGACAAAWPPVIIPDAGVTVRNYAASLGIAVLGTILITMLRSDVTSSLTAMGVPGQQAAARATQIAQSQGSTSTLAAVPRFVRVDFAHASQTVFLVMAGIMAAAALVALTGLRAGRQEEPGGAGTVPGLQAPHEQAGARP